MNASLARELGICAVGAAQANLEAIGPLRKRLPAWVPPETAGHFLKYADEQTVVAVAALDQAITAGELPREQLAHWSVIAAPRCIGRLAGWTTLDRFARGGGPAISPHVIPQHSLHSVSGALSILLASHEPNLGVGGGADSLVQGLLAAFTLPRAPRAVGTWLIATAWSPEPKATAQENNTAKIVCYAVALGLSAQAAAGRLGRLRLTTGPADDLRLLGSGPAVPAGAVELCQALAGAGGTFRWPLAWGGRLTLELAARAGQLRAAA